MKKTKCTVAVSLVAILVGCSTLGLGKKLDDGVYYSQDEYSEGTMHTFTTVVWNDYGKFGMAFIGYPDGDRVTIFRNDYLGKSRITLGWAYMGTMRRFTDGTVKIRTDSGLHVLKPGQPPRQRVRGENITQSMFIDLPVELVREMAQSSSVSVQAWTRPIDVDMVKLKYFYDNYVAMTPVPPPVR